MENKFDVIVAGGGMAGFAAAAAAARESKKVLLIESSGALGGAASAGLVYPFARYRAKDENGNIVDVNCGIFAYLLEKMQKLYSFNSEDYVAFHDAAFHHEILKLALDEITEEAGVNVLFHSFVTAADTLGDELKSVTVCNKSGCTTYSARCFIDCTGDADLVYLSGGSYHIGSSEDGLCQPMTMCFRVGNVDVETYKKENEKYWGMYAEAQKNGELPGLFGSLISFPFCDDGVVHFNSTRVIGCNPLDAAELSKAEQEGRRQVYLTYSFLKEHCAAFKNSILLSSASSIGVRESRVAEGEYTITADDILNCRKFEDSVACGAYLLDIHNAKGSGVTLKEINGIYYQIPYRSIVVKGKKNLLVAGRCISATHEALGAVRAMPICCSVGEAAGISAAVYCEQNDGNARLKTLSISEIKERIAKKGGKCD